MTNLSSPDGEQDDKRPPSVKARLGHWARNLLQWTENLLEYFLTICYHEMLQRNTILPLTRIAKESNAKERLQLFSEWANVKSDESKYTQLAGGFLFTTVASCLTWDSVERGHWSASALFYSSTVFALIAIISGSQHLWVLPRLDKVELQTGTDGAKQAQVITVVMQRIWDNRRHKLKARYIFTLQAPVMMLTFSVMTFLAGLCSVVYSPLAMQLAWDSEAKIAVVFSVAAVLAVVMFTTTSTMVYALFRSSATPC